LALAAFDCWTHPSSPALLTRAETLTFAGDACDAFADASACAGPALFDAPAATPACAALFCETPPLSPGWSTRAVTFVLPGCVCVEVASALACPFALPFPFAAGFLSTGPLPLAFELPFPLPFPLPLPLGLASGLGVAAVALAAGSDWAVESLLGACA
jgi:hypothetical protein